jgi:hypothetical protein
VRGTGTVKPTVAIVEIDNLAMEARDDAFDLAAAQNTCCHAKQLATRRRHADGGSRKSGPIDDEGKNPAR